MVCNNLLTSLSMTFCPSVFQVVKMLMGVVTIFLVCWLPYHTYFITANLYPSINYSHYIQVTCRFSSNCKKNSSDASNYFFFTNFSALLFAKCYQAKFRPCQKFSFRMFAHHIKFPAQLIY